MSEVRVDRLVADIAPAVPPPAITRRAAVLVTGPWLAGTSSVAQALRRRLPDIAFVEADELAFGQAPLAVVFVVSAAAGLTPSDCRLLDAAAVHTDLVIGAVAKIDLHRCWRETVDADRAVARAHDDRYAAMPWVGVSAAPDIGEPVLDELVAAVRDRVACPLLDERNHMRAWESRIVDVASRYRVAAAGAGREARAATLREQRAELLEGQRSRRGERAVALRGQLQQARVQLSYFAASRCTSVRTELQEDAAALTHRNVAGFAPYVARRSAEVVADVSAGVTEQLTAVARDLELPAPPTPVSAAPPLAVPPLRSRTLETRLMLLLGAGFGLGVAVALSRLLAGVAPGLAVLVPVLCALVGIGAALWVVRTRGLLHDRAVLDRWVADVVAGLRPAVDRDVSARVVAAESAWTAALADDERAGAARARQQVAAIEAELREHAMAGARALAERDRELPALDRALAAVRTELRHTMDSERHREECGCMT